MKFDDHLVSDVCTVKEVLNLINEIGLRATVLFVVGPDRQLRGSVTDGDIRRALIHGVSVDDNVCEAMNRSCRYLVEGRITKEAISELRQKNLSLVPVIDANKKLVKILNLEEVECVIPVETVLMAGGKGLRMLPLTRDMPKPLLKVGEKPIIEYNIDRLIKFGINRIHICVNYLGDKIRDYFEDGTSKEIQIGYIFEDEPLGTIGGLSLLEDLRHDSLLLMNSDLLTNIDFGHLYEEFVESEADLVVASIPYHVDLPYAVMEFNENAIISLQEKPRYTYFANAGIYLMKKELLEYIPKGGFYNSTDLVEAAIANQKKVIDFPILGYWLDIGRMSDYLKAQEDIKYIEL